MLAPVGAAFIGGGFMADVHSRSARASRARLVGVVSSTASRANAAAADLGIEIPYAELDLLLANPDVDVVHVCTPNATHAEIALSVIAAGKHVICEKPLATSVDDAAALAEAARAAGVTATVPFVYRFHPMVREARARFQGGLAGRLLSVQGSYLQDWLVDATDDNWRVNDALGGPSRAFADIGSHLVDLIEFVTGDRIARLNALTSTAVTDRATNRDIRTEDLAAVIIETASGAIGTILVSQVAPGRKNRLAIELHGSAESLAFDQEQPESLWIGRRTGSALQLRNDSELHTDAARLSTVPAGHPMGYLDAFTSFVGDSYAAIRGENPDGLPTFDDGLRAVRITDAVLISAATGNWVTIDPSSPMEAA